jgi:hypothetical protein
MKKVETYKEPPEELLERYFKEIREGRSRKSVATALRKQGYTISETVLRHRYEVWLAYQQAKEAFEKKLNYLKGEILRKIEERLDDFYHDQVKHIVYLSYDNRYLLECLLGEELVGELTGLGGECTGPPIIDKIDKKINEVDQKLQQQINYLVNQNQVLKAQISLLAYILKAVITGIRREKEKGLFSKKDLWDLIEESGLEKEAFEGLEELIRQGLD